MDKPPVDVVAEQVKAYNARDEEAFVSCYSHDVQITDLLTGRIITSGIEELRRLYRNVLDNTQDLHCEVLSRIMFDRFVIDREIVTGLPGDQDLHAVAIYEVREDRIQRVWMVKN